MTESKSARHIIFLHYLTGMKIVSENFEFQYSKNFLRIRFFEIGLKISTDLHKTHYLKIRLPHFQITIKY